MKKKKFVQTHAQIYMGFPGVTSGKGPTCQCRKHKKYGFNLSEIPLEEEMATYSTILAWRIPWTEEPGGLQSIGSQELDTMEAT